MSWKRIIFAFIAFVLALGLYVVDRMQAEKAVYVAVNEASLAPGINASEVVEVTLRNRYGDMHFVREGERAWRMKRPMDSQADAEIIEQLLVNVTGARKRNEIQVSSLEEYGLDNPSVQLTLKTSSNKFFELAIGLSSTYTGQVFATYPNSNRVFTINEGVKNTLMRSPNEFLRLRLMDIDIGALDSYTVLRISGKEKEVELRNERGQWRITVPESLPAENSVVEEFLRRLGSLRASGFVTQASDKPTSMAAALEALAHPVLVLKLERAGNAPTTLTVGVTGLADSSVYVARRNSEPEILYFGHEKFEELAVDENYFRSRAIFTLRPADVGYVVFEIGRSRVDLMRNEKGLWEFVGDPTRKVDQEKVDTRLETLLKLRIREYVDMDPRDPSVYGLQPPRFRFTVTARDKSRSEILEIGKSEPQNVTSAYARKGGETAVFTIDMPRELVVVAESLADPHFAAFDEQRAVKITIELNGQKYELLREGPEWKVLRPGQSLYTPVDLGKLKRVFTSLNQLSFEKDFTASGERVIAPVEKPSLLVSVYGDNETTLTSLRVGKRLPKTSFVEDSRQRTYEVLNSELDLLTAQIRSALE
jgi:hypothetical protein